MFKEIAVDPAALASSYLQFNHIIDRFGIPEGRLIAAFPSRWKRLVYDAASKAHINVPGHLDLKRIEERLSKLPKSAFMFRQRPGDGCDVDWIASALQEHKRLAFDAVITSNPVPEAGFVIPSDVNSEHPNFVPNRQWHVHRSASPMSKCCAPILSESQHVKLIDPHFKPARPKFSRPFFAFLDLIRPKATVDIYRCDDCDPNEVAKDLDRILIDRPKKGSLLRLFIRPKPEMHNRFVLGDCGGLSFQIGLDEDDSGGERPDDIVTVLQTEIWRREWDEYEDESPVASIGF